MCGDEQKNNKLLIEQIRLLIEIRKSIFDCRVGGQIFYQKLEEVKLDDYFQYSFYHFFMGRYHISHLSYQRKNPFLHTRDKYHM